jgi:benzylsuccinate CoA-transferase BbsE subunit
VTDPVDTPLALSDIRVLDLSGEPGWYCGKLLAELGADVIKVEPPGGDPGRRIGPFYHDEVDPQKSLYFFAHNTSKRSVTLNVATADGLALFRRLVATADVVIESFPPGFLESLGVGYQALAQARPGIIVASITGFGQSGPHSHYKAPDIVAVAMSGMMYLAGFPEEAPIRPYGNQSYYCASVQAATGILTALLHRDRGHPRRAAQSNGQRAPAAGRRRIRMQGRLHDLLRGHPRLRRALAGAPPVDGRRRHGRRPPQR